MRHGLQQNVEKKIYISDLSSYLIKHLLFTLFYFIALFYFITIFYNSFFIIS